MKKILNTCLTFIMAASLCSCSAQSPMDVLTNAKQNNEKQSNYTQTLDMTMSMDYSGMTLEMPINVTEKVVNYDSNNLAKLQSYITVEMSLLGQSSSTELWLKDSKVYSNTNDEKTVTDADSDTLQSFVGTIKIFDDTSWIESITSEKNGDDNVLTIVFKKDSSTDILQSLLDSAETTSLDLSSISEVTISTCKVTVNNSLITKMELDASMTAEEDGVSTTTGITYTTSYSDFGNTSIDYPSDLDQW